MIPLGKLSSTKMTWTADGTIPRKNNERKVYGLWHNYILLCRKNLFILLTSLPPFTKKNLQKASADCWLL